MNFLEDVAGINYVEPTLENVVLMMRSLDVKSVSLSRAKHSNSEDSQENSSESFDIYAYEGERLFIREKGKVKVTPKSTEWSSEEESDGSDEKDSRFRNPRDSEISTLFRYLKPKVKKQIKEDLIRDRLNQFKNQQD